MSLKNRLLQAANESLDIAKYTLPVEAIPSGTSLRVAVLADLHMNRPTDFHARVLEALVGVRPDLILIAGDSTDETTDITAKPLAPFFARVARTAPAVAVLGNNDCDPQRLPALRAVYRQTGVTLLENEERLIRLRGHDIKIIGLTDPAAVRRGLHPERAPEAPMVPLPAAAAATKVLPTVMLIHRPELAREYAALRPTLIVSGHAHGGQIRLPLIGGLYAPGQGLLPRLTSGLYDLDGAPLLVSRGIGNHVFHLRVNNRPHLPVVEFVGAKRV
ncbi:MAG: metallophosphoesterase family protein [Oscillospiraceae bacterium]|jgi:predicted MPP superfamily phosphohydrolase|nr:metallophosphoesterase family protein [Oscillospiraceae bacterium]